MAMTKRSGRARALAEKVYDVPYWIDRARSLAELEGRAGSRDTGTKTGLVGRYLAADATPIGQLTTEQLNLLFGQGAAPAALHFLVPIALEHLGVGSYEADVLEDHLRRIDKAFWATHPALAARVPQP